MGNWKTLISAGLQDRFLDPNQELHNVKSIAFVMDNGQPTGIDITLKSGTRIFISGRGIDSDGDRLPLYVSFSEDELVPESKP